jgi:4-hydroxy-2-oxoheptanedioate aldolase
MPDRLNGAIAAWETGRPVFSSFAVPEMNALHHKLTTPYDAVVFDAEHAAFDVSDIRNGLQHMLDRRAILQRGTLAPEVTPLVRIAANGAELNQWQAKQALDIGAYGVVWPNVSTVQEARNAVSACRYPRRAADGPNAPPGVRGFGPTRAARYWGVDVAEYYRLADAWPLAPDGELVVAIMCEQRSAVDNLPDVLAQVPGIGAVLIGVGDLALDMGHLGAGHPDVRAAIDEVLAVCQDASVPCGIPGVTSANVEEYLAKGFRWLLTGYFGDDDVVATGHRWLAND